MNKYLQWAGRQYPLRVRLTVLGVLATVFLGFLPILLVRGSARLDRRLGLPRRRTPAGVLAGSGIGAIGALLALSSIRAQVDTGSGTPLPMMPTQRLVVQPPFTYCRNPMTLGAMLGYGGIAVIAGSVSGLGLVMTAGTLVLVYVRLAEEKELAARFGAEYLEYKRQTPFIVPRLRSNSTRVTPAPTG